MFKRPNNFDRWRTFPFAESGLLKSGVRPRISIVIPCFNHGKFLAEAIRSTQAAGNNYELEIIVVDDGSTDDTIKVLQQIHLPNLKKFSREHAGLANTLNFGFTQATGEFVTWTSADNRYLPGALDRMANFLMANPSVAMTYANIQLIDDSGKILRASGYRRDNQREQDTSILDLPCETSLLDVYSDNFINACFLFRRSISQQVGDHDPEKLGFEDYDYWLRIADYGLIAHLDTEEPLYQYRLHENTLTANLRADALQRGQLEMLEERATKALHSTTPHASTGQTPANYSLLRRARDANFGAIQLRTGERFAAVMIHRGWSPAEELRIEVEFINLIDTVPECRFVIVNWSGREIEPELRSKLESKSNFQLLDFSAENADGHIYSSGQPNRWASLSYALSSADIIVEMMIGTEEASIRRSIDTLLIAALSRRNAFIFHPDTEYARELLAAPHAIFVDPNNSTRTKYLRELFRGAVESRPPLGSCEQFIVKSRHMLSFK